MRSFLLVAVITLVGFVAGGAAGIWYERHLPLPPPPFQPLSEFRGGMRGGPGGILGGPPGMHRPINREDLIKTIENLRPKLEAFQQRLDEINAEFNRNLDAVLHADQRSRHAEDMKRHHRPPGTGPLTDDNIAWMLREGSNRIVMWDVVIPFRLDQLTNQYGLDDSQRELVRALLVTRRGEFLELVDASPPPTIALSRLAQMVQRLKQPPPPAPPAPAHP